MRLLVDTHVFLWATTEPERLSSQHRKALEDPLNVAYLSMASAWEISIKYATGKLSLPLPPAAFLPAAIARTGFEILPIRLEHAAAVATLPLHHTDPFDRMLVAQATIDALTLITVDRAFEMYPTKTLAQ